MDPDKVGDTTTASSTAPLEVPRDVGHRYTIIERVQALTLHSVGFKAYQIERMIGVKERQAYYVIRKAKARGFDPSVSLKVLEHHVVDGARSGRPRKNPKPTDESPVDLADGDEASERETA